MFSLLRKKYFNKLSKQLLIVVESAADLNCQERVKKASRPLSTLNYSTTFAGATNSKDDRHEFMALFPALVKNLTEYASKYQSNDAVKLYEKTLQCNLPRGKKNRGLVTVQTFKMLANKTQLNSDNMKLAQYLGWCVDMVMSACIMVDDIRDGSATRRGQPCSHKLEEVGLTAINDSIMILNGIYHILKENFAHKEYYVKLLELFQEVIFTSSLGQNLDLYASKSDVSSFTMERYKSIAENKTCVGFYLPVALAMHLCGFTDPEVYRQSRTILYELGSYYQIENDFNDCFGDLGNTGLVGTDIQENKCSWLAVVCMEKASGAQKEIMRECYGKTDPVKVAQVKHLYEELGLKNLYTSYKEETINMVKTRIQQDSGSVAVHLYRIILPFLNTKS